MKLIGWPITFGLLWLMLPGSLRADTIYTYTGNAYTDCSGTYASSGSTCAGTFALSLTMDVDAQTPLDNITFNGSGFPDITADVHSFSATDGSGLTLTQANAYISISIDTDENGNITSWLFLISNGIQTQSFFSGPAGDVSTIYSYIPPSNVATTFVGGGESFSPGTWSMEANVTPNHYVPEPSPGIMLGIGLLGLLALAARSKRRYGTPFLCCSI